MRRIRLACLMPVLVGLVPFCARADVTLPKVIGDNMVLQRGRAVPIWGQAAPGEHVIVRFASQQKETTTDASGKWQIALESMSANSTPAELTVAGNNKITLKNILIGEVWLCSGQSNMEFPMKPTPPGMKPTPTLVEAQTTANNPQIRLFKVEKNERAFTSSGWSECTPETVSPFSAVGYFFGRELQQELKVPIGLIQSAWGGSHIEKWTPADAYEKSPIFTSQATSKPVRIDGQRAGQYFEPMVRPLAPFALRGALWYQGESNIINSNDGPRYVDKFKLMLDAWRELWGQGEFPMYTVQIAPYRYARRNDPLKHSEEELPLLWQAQTACLKLTNVGMAGTMDMVDDFNDIHPPNKWDVGHRLALWALNKDYGRAGVIHSGPIFKSVEFQGANAKVSFYSVGGGLSTRDGKPLSDFAIAGADGNFEPADAVVEGNIVVVTSSKVREPKRVRFGWNEIAQPNFINKNGLPAIPFQSP